MSSSRGDCVLSPDAELHALVTAFPDVGFILNAEGEYVEVLSSPETESLLYDDPAELLGSRIETVFEPEMAETFTSNITAAVESGELQEFEYSLGVGDGERHFEARVAPVATADGRPHVVYVARDVTERERRQQVLARQRDYMQAMLDSLDDVFYALDREGTLVDWNRTIESVSGYDASELSQCALREVFGQDAGERLEAFVTEVFEQGSARRVTEIRTRTGVEIPYEFVASRFEDPAGEDLVVGIGRDVTERREREEQARVFGRVLRHNMRNKMTVVDGVADYVERHCDDSSAAVEEVTHIRSAARDLMRLTEKAHDATEVLLEETEMTTVNVAKSARGVLDDARDQYPRATFSYRGPDRLAVEAIPAIRLAVSELVENAVEHGSTNPASRTRQDVAGNGGDGPAVAIDVRCQDGTAVVRVADDGPGLPDHEANIITRERDISPVFHASGIGLWLVRWIVTRSRGDIRLDTGPDGTTAVLELATADGPRAE